MADTVHTELQAEYERNTEELARLFTPPKPVAAGDRVSHALLPEGWVAQVIDGEAMVVWQTGPLKVTCHHVWPVAALTVIPRA